MKEKLEKFPLFEFIFFAWSFLTFLYVWLSAFRLKFTVDIFDHSLRLVTGLYAAKGFIPYKDFGFVYPPGLLMLSELFHLNFSSRYRIFALLFLCIALPLLYFFYKKTKSFFHTALFIFILMCNVSIAADPFQMILFFALATVSFYYFKLPDIRYLLFIFFLNFSLFLLRWEWPLFFLAISLVYGVLQGILRKPLRSVVLFIGTLVGSLVASFGSLLVYLALHHIALSDALYWIFVVPLKIMPYRRLPLPSLGIHMPHPFGTEYVVYFLIALFLLLCATFIVSAYPKLKSAKWHLCFLLLFPLTTLPYSMGRADFPHALPLLFSLFLAVILYSSEYKKLYPVLVLFALYICFQFPVTNLVNSVPDTPYYGALNEVNKNCNAVALANAYQSLFVGRTDYSNYNINHAMLYLINPAIKPATRYISDEPGLQNNCEDGNVIASDLHHAKKPMLAYLEYERENYKEPNKSSSMKSCKKIENWLQTNLYTVAGYCTQAGKKYEVRVYQ
ncbi:hypothetical protein HGA88_01360 [Candidatus Roizmanbacteria bacterium]|nr:hypothetical protein [Candidatus Roizmanbacteria bacterium]